MSKFSAFEKYLEKGFGNKANHKYFKRIPNPHFNGKNNRYIYFYNQQEYNEYKKTGKLPEDKGKNPEERKLALTNKIMDNLVNGNSIEMETGKGDVVLLPIGTIDKNGKNKLIIGDGKTWWQIDTFDKNEISKVLERASWNGKYDDSDMQVKPKRVRKEISMEKLNNIESNIDKYDIKNKKEIAKELHITPSLLDKMIEAKKKGENIEEKFKLNDVYWNEYTFPPLIDYQVLREAGYFDNNKPTEKMKKLDTILNKIATK